MDVPSRLKWRKEKDRFVAHPTATDQKERLAEVWHHRSGYNTNTEPYGPYEIWAWRVHWNGWFSESGFQPSKQAAADAATEAWWKNIQTEIPRNESLEAAMIVARAMVRPPPNSLFSEEAEYLRTVMWHLHNVYSAEIAAGLPAVKNLYDQISAEFARRRESGEIPDQPKGEAFSTGYRRRRRR